ncbi:MAG TPA: SGNH/GDSL hydrolase family protein [Magnetospirillaceae bacterium]|nr:SGNH/GDSL hydrolase family protein [Magnetospirillaceae bacterium]
MRQKINSLAGVIALAVFACSVVAVQTPTQASPAEWKHLLDAVNSETVLTHPNGSVSIGQVAGSGPSAIQTVTRDIAVSKISASSNPSPSPSTYLWAAGANNTVYTPAVQFVGYYVQRYLTAYQNGTTLWSVLPPDTCAGQIETIYALKQGADGNIYIVSGRQSGCNGPEFFLSGINAQNGSTLFSVSLGSDLSLGAANFFAYTSGLAILSGSAARLRYYSYQGVLQLDAPLVLSTDERVSAATATHDGVVYAVVSKNRSATGGCPWTNVADRVEAYGPNGVIQDANQQPVMLAVEPCANIYAQASPNGLALIVQAYGLDDRLLSLDTALHANWYKAFDTGTIAGREFPTWLGHDIVVDNTGNIVTISPYWTQNQQRRGVQIGVVNATGERTSVVYTDQLEETSSSFTLTANGIGLAQGTLYLAAHVCNSYQCDTSHPLKLYSVPAAGLGMDYPRGRLAGQLPTPQTQRTYVAMGDSYSAGEGVEPFISPSGSNGCHRGYAAYPRLLDESPATDLKLSAFVACSGATTATLKDGANGEPSQLDTLNQSIDIVTVTIGGNDIDFVGFAASCALYDCHDSTAYDKSMNLVVNELPGDLDDLFSEIETRIGPQTRVLVMGYPRLMPYGMDEFPSCSYLSEEERIAIKEVTRGLNSAIATAVGRAGSQFEFVDADINLNGLRTSPFAGHELCSDGAYFHGASVPVGYSYHPNQLGQTAYEELVRRYLLTHS